MVAFDLAGQRFFAHAGTYKSSPDTFYVKDQSGKPAYQIDQIFGGKSGGLRLGLANMDDDSADELLVIRDFDSTTKVFDLFADKATLIDTLLPGGYSGWV